MLSACSAAARDPNAICTTFVAASACSGAGGFRALIFPPAFFSSSRRESVSELFIPGGRSYASSTWFPAVPEKSKNKMSGRIHNPCLSLTPAKGSHVTFPNSLRDWLIIFFQQPQVPEWLGGFLVTYDWQHCYLKASVIRCNAFQVLSDWFYCILTASPIGPPLTARLVCGLVLLHSNSLPDWPAPHRPSCLWIGSIAF